MQHRLRAIRDAVLSRAARGPLIMGILNVTPDSFSDGGQTVEPQAALARALEMSADGADIVDVGGESTRPGAEVVPEATELARIERVIICTLRSCRRACVCRHLQGGCGTRGR